MKPWLGLLLMLVCGTSGAADWVVVHTAPEGDQYFYDASKLAISGNEITYWKKVTFKSPYSYKGQQVVSALHRERIHCSEHTVKPLTHIVHAVSGADVPFGQDTLLFIDVMAQLVKKLILNNK